MDFKIRGPKSQNVEIIGG